MHPFAYCGAMLAMLAAASAQPAEEAASLQQLLQGLTTPGLVRGAVRAAVRDAGRCGQDMQRWEQAAGERWALQMEDSWSKSISGILYGRNTELGNLNECLDSTASYGDGSVTARFAQPKLVISSQAANASWALLPLPVWLRVSLCVPESCPVELLQAGMQALADSLTPHWQERGVTANISFPGPFQSVLPYHLQMRAEHWLVLCLILVLLIIPIVATAVELQSESEPSEVTTRRRMLLFFSLRSGYRRLAAPDPPTAITCLNGIRVLSVLMIMLGHVYSAYNVGAINMVEKDRMSEGVGFMFLINYNLAVDSFFGVTGMLCAMSLFKDLRRSPRFNWFSYAFHRYLRLTPVVGLWCVCVSPFLFMFVSGPAQLASEDKRSCSPHWWLQLLYLTDYITPDSVCDVLIHLWYLSADFKLYVLAPVVVLPLFWWPVLGSIWLVLVTLASCLSPAIISVIYGLSSQYDVVAPPDEAQLILKTLYKPMHAHAAPFMMGIIFGVFLYKRRTGQINFKVSKITSVLLHVLAAGLLLGVVLGSYIPYDAKHHPYDAVETFFFNGFYRAAWSVGVLLLVLISEINRTGIVNAILSWGGFTVFSRLSFATYVLQTVFMFLFVFHNQTSILWSPFNLMRDVVVVFAGTSILAAIVFLFVEQPFMLLVAELKRRPNTHSAKEQTISKGAQHQQV